MFGFTIIVEDLEVGIEPLAVAVDFDSGIYTVTLTAEAWLNEPDSPFSLYTELLCIGDTCAGYLERDIVTVTWTLSASPTAYGWDVVSDDSLVSTPHTEDDLSLLDCDVGALDDTLAFVGLTRTDLLVDGVLGAVLQDLVDDAAASLEDAAQERLGLVCPVR